MSSRKLEQGMPQVCEGLGVFLALCVVTVRPMFPGLAVPLHRTILIYLVVGMSALLVTLCVTLRKRLERRARVVTLLLLAFGATTVVTAVLAEYRFAAVVRMLDILAWCVLAVVLIQVISTPGRARLVLAALIATLAVLAAKGFYQYSAELDEIQRQLPEYLRQMHLHHPGLPEAALVKRATSGDVFGTFVIANSFAGYLIVLLPAAFAATLVIWREKKTHISIAGALVGLTALAGLVVLFLTRSKGGILALLAALATGAIVGVLPRIRGRRAAAAAMLLLVAVMLTAQGSPTGETSAAPPKSGFWLGDSAEVRIEYWKGSWQVFRQHPWLGVGPGNFAEHYHQHRTPEGSETLHAHNDYIEIAVEQGLVGVAVYLALWAAWFLGMRRKAPKTTVAEGEERKDRRRFALILGVVGVASVLFTMSGFETDAETGMMILVGTVVWLAVYAAQARHVVTLEEAASSGRLLRGAVLVGVCAFLVHSAIDFDFNVPGVTRPLAAVLAVGLALRPQGKEKPPRTLGTGGQLALTAAVAVPMALVLVLLFYPLIDMSIAMEKARATRTEHAESVEEAERARERGDLKTFSEKMRRADVLWTVDLPKHLREALAACPGNTEPAMQLAALEAAKLEGDPRADRSRLEELLREVKRRRPRDPTPYLTLARVLDSQVSAAEEQGLTELIRPLAGLALREVEQAVARYPTRPRTRVMQARLLERLGRRGEAAAEYRKALDLAARTSQKELKFPPEEATAIQQAIERLEAP